MPKLNIKKRATPSSVHYEPLLQDVYVTTIGLLRELTPAGLALLERAPDYCRMERAILHRLGQGQAVSKPALMKEFGFPGRMVNAAIDTAQGHLDSARECARAALADTTAAITRTWGQLLLAVSDPKRRGERHGLLRKLTRLVHQEAQIEARIKHPSILFGRKWHERQSKDRRWRQSFTAARNDHLSANGGADEAAGNSTLRIELGPTEVISARLWQWFKLRHAGQHLGRFRLWADACVDLTRAVLANRSGRTFEVIPVWFNSHGKKIGPKRQERMEANQQLPASIRGIRRAVTAGREGLTIDLRKPEGRNRWYIHVSQTRPAVKAYTPKSWIGVDLNCDSLAFAHLDCNVKTPQVKSYAKAPFPASGPAAPRAMAVYAAINAVVAKAKAEQAGIGLEFLEFEFCKRWMRSKLGALLRAMPYRKIRAAFERRCLEQGVTLRFVPPKYSSVLGSIVSQRWPALGRDQAAGVVLALRASEPGNQWLERTCEQIVRAEKISLRFNAKGKFGHSALLVTTTSPPEVTTTKARGHQRDHPCFPVEPALYWQVAAGRKIQGGFSSLFADLREQRRAAKAQKHSHPPPCFKMPHQIDVSTDSFLMPRPSASLGSGSSLLRVA